MHLLCLVFYFISCYVLVHADNSNKNKQTQAFTDLFPQKLSPLLDQKFSVNVNESKFYVVITAQNNTGTSVVTEERKNTTVTLGRNNETTWMQLDSWVTVKYGKGDVYNTSECNGTRNANILILCNVNVHKPELKFVGHNRQWKNSCFYMFELVTCAICPTPIDEGMSKGSMFCIIFLTAVTVYLVIGVCYRRLVVGAKGFEQIPNYKFWTKLGNLQADGCNSVCRRQEEETWQRLTSSPKDTQDDQDDALLRP